MEMSAIKRIGVVGAGTMGTGIVHLFAQSGYRVIWYNRSRSRIQSSLQQIRASQVTLVRNGTLTQAEAQASVDRIRPVAELSDLAPVDLVSESIIEDLETKQELFGRLDRICSKKALFTTDTTGLSISGIADRVSHRERFAGVHFFNPPHIIPAVEIIRGAETADSTCRVLTELMRHIGKHPVLVQKEIPGFVAARLQMAVIREALHLVEEGVASAADVDAAMKHGLGLRWALLGPLETADLGGLDVFDTVAGYLNQELCDAKGPQRVLRDLVEAGSLGAKSGSGFYDYPDGRAQQILAQRDEMLLKLLGLKSEERQPLDSVSGSTP